ncbi:hypothetical protein N7462_004905 [Penicillium macrosclerotiorum]|uniref:uncharacterized protein n=1 Tax=Penicillium macrosclerotiorum TaxID=303699 RepID=UPI00254720E5|nr:uncharacterized protein N7462_004905 [Penicillium macrosclerotiorum]KAJ5690513.1 hypothetical protein N7462_004905 [Penicillium macrosclerotiorum]
MSFLTSSIRASSRRVVQSTSTLPSISALHTSTPRWSLKESDKNRDDLPNIYEIQRDHQVKTGKEGNAKWNSDLASNSEADIKADRGEVDSSDKSFQEMQQKMKNIPTRK